VEDTKETKVKKKQRKPFPDKYLEQIRSELRKTLPEKPTKEQAQAAAQGLTEKGFNPGAVIKVIKELTGYGFNIQQVRKEKAGEPPAAVKKVVETKVTKEIAKEATAHLEQVLSTGKNLEDQLGQLAKFYGYPKTSDFIMEVYSFWDTWRDKVETLVEENKQYRWAIRELLEKFTPEAKKVLRDKAIRDFVMSTVIMGQVTGKFPTPESMREYIELLKEGMSK